MRRTTIALLLVGSLAAALPAIATTASNPDVEAAPEPGSAGEVRPPVTNLVSVCNFSHAATDDPIVFPGASGGSHLHQFFGNTSTEADSTVASMQDAGTTCTRLGDTAAYWVPALIDGGEVQRPSRAQAYYTLARKDAATIEAFPADLRVVAGGADAPAPASQWGCVDPADREPVRTSMAVPQCEADEHLVARVIFPDCWDGVATDSDDHRSHLTYSRRGDCPSTHPVALPRLRLTVHYPGADGGDDLALSSGGPETLHADFWNTWDQAELERLVEECLVGEQQCGPFERPRRS